MTHDQLTTLREYHTTLPPSLPQSSAGGLGDVARVPVSVKSELVLIRRAIRNRWPIKVETLAKVAKLADEMLTSADGRVKAAAMKTVVEMNKQNIVIDQEEDKTDRLDAGKLTENHGGRMLIVGVDPNAL